MYIHVKAYEQIKCSDSSGLQPEGSRAVAACVLRLLFWSLGHSLNVMTDSFYENGLIF